MIGFCFNILSFKYFIKLAIARVLCQLVSKDILFKLKSSGLLTRDCRCKERKSSSRFILKFVFDGSFVLYLII